MHIISIVPRLPPSIDGVGDYALSTARALKQQFGIDTEFIVCDPLWMGNRTLESFTIHALSNRNSGDLAKFLQDLTKNPSMVLLHMSGYGYARWALCNWLVEGLRRWKYAHPQVQLVTMFHELYCNLDWPWRHSFWVAHLQKRIAENLAQLSDVCITTRDKYVLDLENLSHGKHQNIQVSPMASIISESDPLSLLVDRLRPEHPCYQAIV